MNVRKITELEGHQSALYTITEGFQKDELLSAGSERFVAKWNLDHPELAEVIAKASGVIYSLLKIPELNLLLVGNDQGGIHVVDISQKLEIRYLLAHKKGVFDLCLNADKSILYAAGGDGQLSIWDVNSFECILTVGCGELKIRQLAFSPNGEILAIACGDTQIRILDIKTNEIISQWEAHEMSVNALCFNPSGDVLMSGGKDAYLNVWDVKSWSKIHSIPAHNYAIYSIVMQPDGKFFATGSRDKTVKIWDAANFDFLIRLDHENWLGHTHSVNKVLWKDDNLLISAGDDRRVILWEIDYLFL